MWEFLLLLRARSMVVKIMEDDIFTQFCNRTGSIHLNKESLFLNGFSSNTGNR
jgi:hypothetical protein